MLDMGASAAPEGGMMARTKVTRDEAPRLYHSGRIPQQAELSGIWEVRMWGRWNFMRLDRKYISGSRGYNRICGIKWGHFRIESGDKNLMLVYDDGKITDYLRLHPTDNDLMIGRFCTNGKYRAMFTLERRR